VITLTQDELVAILITALNELRKEADGDLYATKALALLHVLQTPGVAQMDLHDVIGVSAAANTRNVQDWTIYDRNRERGRDFIAQNVDPAFRKRNLLTPTPKGQAFAKRLTDAVNRTLAGQRPR